MRTVSITILFSFLWINVLIGQDTLLLDINTAMQIALDKNINIRQEQNNLEINKLNKIQNMSYYLPDLNISMSGSNKRGRQFNNELGAMRNTNINNANITLSSNFQIFNGFGRIYNYSYIKNQYEAQENFIEQTKQNTLFNVTMQYLQVLLDKELIRITQENIVAQKVVLEQIKGFVEVNIKSVVEQYTQEAQVKLLEVQLINLKNQLINDKAILSSTLMLDKGKNYKLTVPDWSIDLTLLKELEFDSLWSIALQNRPDLKVLQNQVKASFYNLKIARSSRYPSLKASYSFSTGYNDNYLIDDIIVESRRQIFDDNPVNTVVLTLSIPIFNYLQTQSTIVNNKITYENNLLNYQALENSVYSQIESAYNGFLIAKESYAAGISGLNAAKISFEKQTERFNLGIGNIVEYSQASQNYIQAQAVEAQAEYSLLFQKIIIDYYTGILNINNLYYE